MKAMERLLEIMARLRDPAGGCPWDLEQTFATIAPYTIEEAYEVDDAIRRGDLDALRDELGDLLLQVVYHAQMAREAGAFAFEDVAEAIGAKLVRRHPHVFGEARVADAAAQTAAWEEHKAAERARLAEAQGARASAYDGLPLGLPALLRAQKLLRRAIRAGGAPAASVATAAADAARALVEAEAGADGDARAAVGALLESAVRLAEASGVDAEEALRETTARTERALRAGEGAASRVPRGPGGPRESHDPGAER